MNSHEAMKESAGEQNTSIIAEIAHRVNIHSSTAYAWTRPRESSEDPCAEKGSGKRNPVDVLTLWMEACLILGRPRSAALAPLSHLNRHFGQIVFSVPSHVKSMSPDELSAELIRCMKEFGDVVKAYQEAIKNKRISKQELKSIEREVYETVTELMTFLHCVKEAGVF